MLVLSGMIGAGKTTYTKKLSEELGTEAFYEEVDDNPILDLYYSDPEQYAFSLQIYFLNKRFHTIKNSRYNPYNVLDRSIFEDALFTRVNALQGNISEECYAIYEGLLNNILDEISHFPKEKPHLLIYLDGSFDHILENIKKRGRPYEQVEGRPDLLEYYQLLYKCYQDWYRQYDFSEKIAIPIDQYNIVDNDDDWAAVFDRIKSAINQQIKA